MMTHRHPDILQQAEKLANEMMTHFPAAISFHALHRGAHGRRKTGSGDDFWQFRDYQQGDNPRQIDWKQTAKTDRVFLREREEAAPQSLFFYREPSSSMDYASRSRLMSKRDYADVIWLAMSYMAVKAGERVTVPGYAPSYASRQETIPDIYARAHFADAASIREMQGFIVSDFCKPVDEVKSFIDTIFNQGNSGVVIHVSDPAEISFPFSGHIILQDDLKTSLEIPAAHSMQEIYLQKFQAHKAEIETYILRKGFTYLHLTTDMTPASALVKVIGAMGGG